MVDLELTRSRDDRRVCSLDGVGNLRLEGTFARSATAEAAGTRWRFARTAFWRGSIEAIDAVGAEAGEFEPRGLRRGGTVRWAGREFGVDRLRA